MKQPQGLHESSSSDLADWLASPVPYITLRYITLGRQHKYTFILKCQKMNSFYFLYRQVRATQSNIYIPTAHRHDEPAAKLCMCAGIQCVYLPASVSAAVISMQCSTGLYSD